MSLEYIISICGRISSGKSYISKLISDKTGFPVASFGKYVVYYCNQNNLPTDRKNLQNVGESFLKNNPKQFLLDVITHFKGKSNSIILDGVRHKVILEAIKTLSNKNLSIYVDAPQETRYKSYYERTKDSDQSKSYADFLASDNHIVELEIDSLKHLCDIIVDPRKDYKSQLLTLIKEKAVDEYK